jgi:DNA polymerase-1
MPRLFLIDGSSQMYRAYHAIRGLTGPDGKSTNAVYGFATMLRKLIADHKPEYIAASFDLAGPTFRDEMATDYKAHREPMPSDLAEQVPLVHEACAALGVPVLTFARFEADDVIGTLAMQAKQAGFEVALVTGDKDFFQLVSDGVRVFNPRDEGTWYDAAGVVEKFGVRPDQVVDVLALMGDSVDNIKGVPGIGEKGARELIATHGTLDKLLEAAPSIAQKRYREGLLAHADDARMSRELARIRTDVPVTFDADALRFKGPSPDRCFKLFSALGFRTLVTEYAPSAATSTRKYRVATSLDEVDALGRTMEAAASIGVAAVSQDTSAVRADIVGWAFAPAPGEATYIPLAHSGLSDTPNLSASDVFARLAPVLANPAIAKVGHDLKFVMIAAARHGVEIRGEAFDTMIGSYLVDATRSGHDVGELALERLNYRAVSEETLTGKGVKAVAFDAVPADSLASFAGERADLPLSLAADLKAELDREQLRPVYDQLEAPLCRCLPTSSAQACVWTPIRSRACRSRMEAELAALCGKIFDLAGEQFNINSPKQLADVLFVKLESHAGKKTGKTRVVSTGAGRARGAGANARAARARLKWRSIQKLKGTYVDALPSLVSPVTGGCTPPSIRRWPRRAG